MADNTEPANDQNVTFKVKSSADKVHTITISELATVLDLKTILSGDDYEKVPANRQRLIYSGRVMKDADQLVTYKIKQNNTIHMVKSAASNPTQPSASSSTPTPQAIPSNMASGTANNPLAGLTGARYAGHQINLPGLDAFGPDGGMGPPMDEERLTRLMADPNVQQSMNEALSNPDFVNMLIESNPMLRNMPNARELITSPFMRQMMSNPQMMGQAMRMQRTMRGQNSAFPAPGATDTTPESAAAGNTGTNNANPPNPFLNNPLMGLMGGQLGGQLGGQQGGDAAQPNLTELIQQLQSINNLMMGTQGGAGGSTNAAQTATAQAGSETTGSQGTTPAQGNTRSPAAAPNPFMALLGGGGGNNNTADGNNSPFAYNPEMVQQMVQMLGGGAPAAPPDNRPPEERYAEQLRQLNDMGFFDFDRNVAALRRSGGSVQGAIEHLLNATD